MDIEKYRREQIRRTWRCLVNTLAMVGLAFVVSGAIHYFAA